MEYTKIEGSLEIKTGLHIGGIKEIVKIGGQDNPVIKMKVGKNEIPYIPGSSLKGKLRFLLESKRENNNEIINIINKMFGTVSYRGHVIFRDAHIENLESYCNEDNVVVKEKLLEIKPENQIDRVSCRANPRFVERVIPGTKFRVEIIVIHDNDEEKKQILEKLKEGFELLQNDYIGGSGTRGYGKVNVHDIIEKINSALGGQS